MLKLHYVDKDKLDQKLLNDATAAGAVSGAKDISESILHAEATAAQVAAHLERLHGAEVRA